MAKSRLIAYSDGEYGGLGSLSYTPRGADADAHGDEEDTEGGLDTVQEDSTHADRANEPYSQRPQPKRHCYDHDNTPSSPNTNSGSSEHLTTVTSSSGAGNDDNATRSPTTFTLTANDLGARMPQTLYELSQEKGFSSVVRGPRIEVEKLDEEMAMWMTPEAELGIMLNVFKETQDADIVRIYRRGAPEGRELEWPTLDASLERPTSEEAESMLETFLQKPPEKVVYCNGLMTMERDDPCPLYAGEEPERFNEITQTSYPNANTVAFFGSFCRLQKKSHT
ncbi:hypothetical protein LRP88_11549 [Fusarium phalaenopsidis]